MLTIINRNFSKPSSSFCLRKVYALKDIDYCDFYVTKTFLSENKTYLRNHDGLIYSYNYNKGFPIFWKTFAPVRNFIRAGVLAKPWTNTYICTRNFGIACGKVFHGWSQALNWVKVTQIAHGYFCADKFCRKASCILETVRLASSPFTNSRQTE